MSTASTQYAHLAPNPKSAYRQLFVRGTRIKETTCFVLSTTARVE